MFILLVSGSFGQIGGGGVNLNFYQPLSGVGQVRLTLTYPIPDSGLICT